MKTPIASLVHFQKSGFNPVDGRIEILYVVILDGERLTGLKKVNTQEEADTFITNLKRDYGWNPR